MTEEKKQPEKKSEAYLVLARKWRPQQFSEVVGQEPIVKTLQNAISANRLAHAYLFCGLRGTGKTTTARIFAKALNCAEGPSVNPCDKCDPCTEITRGSSLDVIEIDGASNRGIDQIRDLRDNVKFAPAGCRFKVYIIDEVHMLTTEAFNALLKTLEEPPAHVKFLFATTESQKVPATILSRCQRFDLKRIKTAEIVEHLKKMGTAEKVEAEESALFAIATQADGSLRDAISLFDQMISYCEKEIKEEDVNAILGLIQKEKYFEIVDAILDKNGAALFEVVATLMSSGKDLSLFLIGLLGHLRSLLLAKTLEKPQTILEMSKEQIEKVKVQAAKVSEQDLTLFIDLAAKGIADLRFALSKRVLLELVLVKMMQQQGGIPATELLQRLEQMEQRLQDGDSAPARAPKMPVAHRTATLERSFAKQFKPQWQAVAEPQDYTETEDGWDQDPSAVIKASSIVVDESKRIREEWAHILSAMAKINPLLCSYLKKGEIKTSEQGTISIGFDEEFNFHREAIDTLQNRESVESQFQQRLGKKFKVVFMQGETSAEKKGPKRNVTAEKQQKLLNDPMVRKASDLFGGRVINIQGT